MREAWVPGLWPWLSSCRCDPGEGTSSLGVFITRGKAAISVRFGLGNADGAQSPPGPWHSPRPGRASSFWLPLSSGTAISSCVSPVSSWGACESSLAPLNLQKEVKLGVDEAGGADPAASPHCLQSVLCARKRPLTPSSSPVPLHPFLLVVPHGCIDSLRLAEFSGCRSVSRVSGLKPVI